MINKDPRVTYFPRVNMQNLIKWVLILTLCLKSKLILFSFLNLLQESEKVLFYKRLYFVYCSKCLDHWKKLYRYKCSVSKIQFLTYQMYMFYSCSIDKSFTWSNDRLAKTMHPSTNIFSNLSYQMLTFTPA